MEEDLEQAMFDHFSALRVSEDPNELKALSSWLDSADTLEQRVEYFEAWVKQVRHGRNLGHLLSAPNVSDFIARLVQRTKADSILDPTCGSGYLLNCVSHNRSATTIEGIDLNNDVCEIAEKILPSHANITTGDALGDDHDLTKSYDLIISEPPLSLRLDPPYELPNGSGSARSLTLALIAQLPKRLSTTGQAVFLCSSEILHSRAQPIWDYIRSQGLSVRACIHVPPGKLKATAATSYIIVVSRESYAKTFLAQYSEDLQHQNTLLSNFQNHIEAKQLALGHYIEFTEFRGYAAQEAQNRLDRTVKKLRFQAVSGEQLFTNIRHVRAKDPEPPNCLYLMPVGPLNACKCRDELKKPHLALCLSVNSDYADASFLAEFFNTDIGHLTLVANASARIAQINLSRRDLMAGTYHLPNPERQSQILSAMEHLHSLQTELKEIEHDIWDAPAKIEKHTERLKEVNHEDSFERWVDTLPFPLASILWRFHANSESLQEQNEVLLHFFEALAEFVATVHLSAMRTDEEFNAEHAGKLRDSLSRANLSFERATFGLWKCVNEYLCKNIRKLLHAEPERAMQLYRTQNQDILKMLTSKDLINILLAANSLRNDGAHGGASSHRDTAIKNRKLRDLIAACRTLMGTTWLRYPLVQPGLSSYDGGEFTFAGAKRIMGTRTPFEALTLKTTEAMRHGYLHLFARDSELALELIPFIRVMPSPKTESNACYYYNRMNGDQQRFVSYHFEAEAEVEDIFEDTVSALKSLLP